MICVAFAQRDEFLDGVDLDRLRHATAEVPRQLNGQPDHLVKIHAAENFRVGQPAPRNQDVTTVAGWNVRIDLRRIPNNCRCAAAVRLRFRYINSSPLKRPME